MKKCFAKIRNCFLLVALLALPLIGLAQNDTVLFSARGGFYDDAFALELFNYYPQNHIRYTVNGNRPTAQSPLYDEPLMLDERNYSKSDIFTIVNCPSNEFFAVNSVEHCIVIRAAVFNDAGQCISQVVTNSYFIKALGCDTHGLPAISICADSLDLFDYRRGIFVPGAWYSPTMPLWTGNYFGKGMAWERLCNVEFYEQDNRGVNQQAGLRTHGGASRRYQQKGMKLFAREEYGKKRFKHSFFSDTPIDNIKHFNLKPFRCSNWLKTGLNDAFSHRVARLLDIDVLGTRAVVVFLNGEYWGVYYMEEATDGHYLEDHYDVNPDSCNIIKNWTTLDEGDDTEWRNLYDWMETADLSQAEDYDYLCSKIDMHNFIDYLIFELYSANVDWPANNVRCWQTDDRKWRWMFYDGDGCFFRDWDVFANIVDTSDHLNPSNATATLFYRRLLKNDGFVERLRTRFEDLLNHRLNYAHTGPILSVMRDEIEGEVACQSDRFGFPSSVSKWSDQIGEMDVYLRSRNHRMVEQIEVFWSLPDEELVGFSCYPNPFSGEIRVSIADDDLVADEIAIYDLMGRKVLSQSCMIQQGHDDIVIQPDLEAGVYVLRIGRTGKIIVKY
jgi:hypothetical protein